MEWREAASAVAVSDGVGFVDGFSVEDDRLLVESSVTVGAGGVPIEVTEVPVPTSPVEGDSVEEVTSVDDVPVGDDGVQVKEVPSIKIQDDISNTACFSTKTSVLFNEDIFFQSESLGTVIGPRCGGCKCSKCPIPGFKYIFKEQKEYDIIQKNLFYDEQKKTWSTEYPWVCVRSVLPRNDKTALQSLISVERNLSRDPEMAKAYCIQIQEMLNRRAAVVLSPEELSEWEGDYYYLPHLGVKQKKKSHPVRVCFDASRKQGGYPSMTDCLFKGPDRFVNNLLSVILGFRNGRVGCTADVSKFHNRVFLVETGCPYAAISLERDG